VCVFLACCDRERVAFWGDSFCDLVNPVYCGICCKKNEEENGASTRENFFLLKHSFSNLTVGVNCHVSINV